MLIYASFRLVKFANRTSELHASVKSKCGCLKIGYLYIHSLIIVSPIERSKCFLGYSIHYSLRQTQRTHEMTSDSIKKCDWAPNAN